MIGTHHFVSLKAVETYYGKQEAQIKLKEGAVCIGAPKIETGQKLLINKSEGRYIIETN